MAVGLMGSTECQDRIQNAFLEMEAIVESGDTTHLDERFGLCEPLNTAPHLDVAIFFASMSGPFSAWVQYHREGDMEYICDYLMAAHENDLEALALTLYGPPPQEGEPCFNVSYAGEAEWLSTTGWEDTAGLYSGIFIFFSKFYNMRQFYILLLSSTMVLSNVLRVWMVPKLWI